MDDNVEQDRLEREAHRAQATQAFEEERKRRVQEEKEEAEREERERNAKREEARRLFEEEQRRQVLDQIHRQQEEERDRLIREGQQRDYEEAVEAHNRHLATIEAQELERQRRMDESANIIAMIRASVQGLETPPESK